MKGENATDRSDIQIHTDNTVTHLIVEHFQGGNSGHTVWVEVPTLDEVSPESKHLLGMLSCYIIQYFVCVQLNKYTVCSLMEV